jgi:hypothetical protein
MIFVVKTGDLLDGLLWEEDGRVELGVLATPP